MSLPNWPYKFCWAKLNFGLQIKFKIGLQNKLKIGLQFCRAKIFDPTKFVGPNFFVLPLTYKINLWLSGQVFSALASATFACRQQSNFLLSRASLCKCLFRFSFVVSTVVCFSAREASKMANFVWFLSHPSAWFGVEIHFFLARVRECIMPFPSL
jgi:hypothetical protein